jgi:hypothetical protein
VSFDVNGTGTKPGTVAITAHITAAAPTDISTDNNSATVTMLIQGTSNVGVSASGPGQQPQVHGQAGLNFTVTNAGPDPATNVRILAMFRNRMQYQKMQVASGGTCTLLQDQMSAVCDCGTVNPGQSVTGSLSLLATAVGTADVEFQVSTDDVDGDNTNDTTLVPLTVAAETTPVTPTTPTSSSGGGGCAYQPGGPFDPALLALVAIGVAGIGARRLRRTQKLGQRVK